MRRRDLLIGSACLVSAAAASALSPHRRLSRLGAASLSTICPQRVGDWSARDIAGLTPPSAADNLLAKLYDEIVERLYRSESAGADILALLAHGPSQTNDLQLHRPEACYPAFGYSLLESEPLTLSIAPGVTLPARRLVADAPGRRERVIYWTRIGDALPTSNQAQHLARLEAAMQGVVYDGVLARFSIVNEDAARSFALLEWFIPAFLGAVGAAFRPALVGAPLADLMDRNGG